jgi:hypothetical protein
VAPLRMRTRRARVLHRHDEAPEARPIARRTVHVTDPLVPGSPSDAAGEAALADATRQVRAPWAASVAGIAFAVLFTVAMVLIRSSPVADPTSSDLGGTFASGGDLSMVIGALYLGPFSGIAFLWFVAVIRDQVGEREDRFFATVFFGSGLLFVALLFAALAVASTPVVMVRYLELPAPTADQAGLIRSLGYALLFGFATRAAAVFLLSTATLGLRTRTFPVWFALTGYAAGLLLLLVVSIWDWIVLLLPAWVAVISLSILRRERGRRPAA